MYEYMCVFKSVYDGDTAVVDIDLGFDIWLRNQHVRIEGVDTPELKASDVQQKMLADEARNFLLVLLSSAPTIRLICNKYDPTEKYGRILADLWVPRKNAQGTRYDFDLPWLSVKTELIAYGRGRAYDGGPR